MTPSHVQNAYDRHTTAKQQESIPSHWVWRGVLLICLGFWGFVIWAVSR